MPADDDQNLRPPFLGPGAPEYPQLPQMVRVYGPAVVGSSPPVYPAYIQQMATPPTLRDREQCYLTEANSIPLGPGYYLARLVSNYAGLPLLATACCPAGGFGSSSSSSAGR